MAEYPQLPKKTRGLFISPSLTISGRPMSLADHCFLHQFAVIKKVDKGPLLCDLFSAASSSTPLSVAALSRAASVKCVNDVASSLHSFSSVVSVDIHVPLLPKASFQDATSVMESILTYSDVIRAVQASKFSLVDDQRVKDSTQSVGALSPKGTTSSSHYVSFLGSPSLLSPSSSSTSLLGARPCPLVTSTSTLLHITGEIHCKAFVLPKISVVAAIDYVKRDFAESLKARIHVLVEEGNGDAAGSGSNGGSYVMMLPRRVFISLGKIPGTGLCMSDYALSTETAEDVLSRAREMCGTNAALINGEEHRGGPTWTRPHTAESGMGMRYRGDGATPSDTASCTATNDTESGLEKGRSSVMLLAIGGIIALLLCMVFIQKI